MPYSKSFARNDFNNISKYIKTQSKTAKQRNRNIPHDIQQFVYRAAIFQISAALEEYIKAIFDAWMFKVDNASLPLSKIPKELTTLFVARRQISHFKRDFLESNEPNLIKSLISDTTIEKCYDPNTVAYEIFRQSDFVSDKKYPSVKNLPVLFKRFGIHNIFDELAAKGKKDYKMILKSFSDIRTEIAHQHPTPDLTHGDVLNQLIRLEDTVDKIDRVLWSHIRKVSGSQCWPSD